MLRFEWDERKNHVNRKKHGIWFEEAVQVFDDSQALLFFDDEHSNGEDRFLLLGMSGSGRVLVVCHCDRGPTIRVISARKAKTKEIRRYEEGV